MEIPSLNVSGKRAIVSGAGSGIGKGIAVGLAHAGADVVITELPGAYARAEETAQEIRSLGRNALVCPLDVTKQSSIDEMVHLAVTEFGRVDILVNNAGVNVAKFAFDVTEEDWDAVLDINLKGVFFCCQAVGREMVKAGGGAIVNVASQNGLVGYYKRAAYCSSKAGVVNLTRVLAVEWAKHNIRVNAIAPTFVLTPLTAPFFEEEVFYNDVMSRIPLGRLAKVEDMVGAVVYLSSPAAAMVTGHTLVVDGGWTAL
ncbi:MAG: glucose 1-dehydrogenase [Chloroflexi bacterium]|nr:glucose 1-dehydrogenase [Chloroflexota bacterium]MDA8187393.1 glucose 1-dehydrogenase [Dehalococcoidales bacterium]